MNLLKNRISVLPKFKKICHPERLLSLSKYDSGAVDKKNSILQIPKQVRNDINSQKNRKLTVGLKKTSFAFIAVFSFLLFACSNGTDYVQAKINSLEFTKSQNSDLSANVSGTIDENTKTITVLIPLSSGQTLTNVKSGLKLAASNVSLGAGTSLVTNLETLNFSTSPVEIVVTTKDETLPYSVIISEKKPTLARNTLAFTEYYNGETYNYKGANKQFIELYNASSETIDLGSVQLNRISYECGVRTPSKDKSVTLSGTLAAGQYLVLTSSKNSDASSWNSSTINYQTDEAYSNIITFNGYDCFTLTSGSTVLDVLGPQNGWPWGNTKHMQRKASVFSITGGVRLYQNRGYQEREWVIENPEKSSTNLSNTVGKATALEESDTSITYFELENSSEYYKTDIEDNKTTRILNLTFYSSTTPNYKQYPTISTNGSSVAAWDNNDWQTVKTGQTELDFSKDIQLRVTSSTGSNYIYTIQTKLEHIYTSNSPVGTYKLLTNLSELNSGDEIIIYYPSGSLVMTTNAATGFEGINVRVDNNEIPYMDEVMSLCVTKFSNGKYLFTNNEKFLTSAKDTTSYALTLAPSLSRYSFWEIESATAGSNVFYIKSDEGMRNNNERYLEVYGSAGEFQTYGYSKYNEDYDYQYQLQIYKKQ